MIPNEKIKTIDYLFNRIISERVRDSIEPKYGLLLGAGCSISSGIESARGIIDILRSIAFLREQPIGNTKTPFIDLEYGKLVSFLQEWFKSNKNDADFKRFIKEETERIYNIPCSADTYFEEVFYQILRKDYPDFSELNSSKKSEVIESLIEEYKEDVMLDLEYSYWFTKYSTSSEDIHSFLSELMNNKNPSEAYILLADLFVNHMFSVAFTTNFDNLLGEALSLLGVRSKEILFDTSGVDNTLSRSSPNIIKLHGDYMYNNTKNLSNETRQLSKAVKLQMENVLSKGGLIVIGYSGSDNSIMHTLEKISEKYSFPLFWCELEEKIRTEKIHWRVKQLILNSTNGYFVPIETFDSFVETLRKNYITYAKLRKIKNDIKFKESKELYDEEYLKISLQRIKLIIDKVIEQNAQIDSSVIPVPPPNVDLLVK